MKYILGALTGLLFSTFFFSCESWNENTNVVLTDTLAVDTMPAGFAAYSPKFQLLAQNDSSFFRGKSLGADKASVNEPALEKIEETSNSITYAIQLAATEQADIVYAFNKKNKLSSIDVFFYLRDDSSLQAFKGEMTDYYSKKLNALVNTKNNKSVLLSPDTNTGIEWTEEGNQKVKDLHMRIFELSSL